MKIKKIHWIKLILLTILNLAWFSSSHKFLETEIKSIIQKKNIFSLMITNKFHAIVKTSF